MRIYDDQIGIVIADVSGKGVPAALLMAFLRASLRAALTLWTPQGYTRKNRRRENHPVSVLTPRPIVECLRHGYVPEINGSAGAV